MPKSWVGKLDLHVAFFPVFVVFLGAGFLLRPTPVWAMVYYAGVLPLFFLHLKVRWDKATLREPLLLLSLAMMAWFGLALAWGIDQTSARVAKYLFSIPVNFSFAVAGCLFFATAEERFLVRLYRVISVVASVNAVISIAIYAAHGFQGRLEGWAETRHPILGANVMAVALIVSLRQWHAEIDGRWRVMGAVSGLLCVAFILLTGSRGPFLAMAGAVACYLIQVRPRAMLGVVAVGVAAAVAVFLFAPGVVAFVTENLNRDSYRLAIWRETLDLVRERPWLGYGPANVREFVTSDITFPHSLYMSSLYYAGVVGLGLLLALLGAVGWRAVSVGDRNLRALLTSLMVVPLIAGLTDIGQFIKSPSEVWYILWLPLLAVLGLSRRARESGGMPGLQENV